VVPELPEVETIRRSLAPVVEGRRVRALEVLDSRWCRPLAPAAMADAVQGRTIERLERRGKYLVFALEGEIFLVCHLRMTGNFLYDAPATVAYQRAVLTFDDGHRLRYCDVRRFGTADLLAGEPEREAFFTSRLGVEPLGGGLDGPLLRELARGRRAPVKSFLLDQRMVAGIGNIYADEALYRAGIHPLRPAGRLRPGQYDRLSEGIAGALTAGLEAGGATIDDFRHPDGLYGSFQDEFQVHRRAGEPCSRCGREIRKFTVGGRGTYACESCQPRPRGPVRR
jgi:formamidopyrimidine-DNA glycosylase